MERSAAWAMIGAMTVSGFIGLFVKESGVDPLTLVFYRCLIGGLVLFILSYWLSQPVPMSWRERLINNAAGLALIVNWWCLFASFNYLPVSYATLLYNLQPFMLLMLSSLFLKEAVPVRAWWLLLLAFLGLTLMAYEGPDAPIPWQGFLLATAAAFLYAVASLLTRKLRHLPPGQLAAGQLIVGAVLLMPWVNLAVTFSLGIHWVYIGLLGVINTAVQFKLLYFAVQHLSLGRFALLSYLYPLVALAVDMTVYQVTLEVHQWMGIGLILLANFWLTAGSDNNKAANKMFKFWRKGYGSNLANRP